MDISNRLVSEQSSRLVFKVRSLSQLFFAMSIRALLSCPGTALWMVPVKPARFCLEKQLLGLLLRSTACPWLPGRGSLIKTCPVAQVNEAPMNYKRMGGKNKGILPHACL